MVLCSIRDCGYGVGTDSLRVDRIVRIDCPLCSNTDETSGYNIWGDDVPSWFKTEDIPGWFGISGIILGGVSGISNIWPSSLGGEVVDTDSGQNCRVVGWNTSDERMIACGPCGAVGIGHDSLKDGYGDGKFTAEDSDGTPGGWFWTTTNGEIG